MTNNSTVLLDWITAERNLSYDLPVVYDEDTSSPTRSSVDACIESFIEPLFRHAGSLRVVGWSFQGGSFHGAGKLVLEMAQMERKDLVLRYSPGLAKLLRDFIGDPSQGRGVLEELRGTIIFETDVASFDALQILQRLSNPHFIRNYKSLFGAAALERMKHMVHSGHMAVLLSDRSDFASVHLFGSADDLEKLSGGSCSLPS